MEIGFLTVFKLYKTIFQTFPKGSFICLFLYYNYCIYPLFIVKTVQKLLRNTHEQ